MLPHPEIATSPCRAMRPEAPVKLGADQTDVRSATLCSSGSRQRRAVAERTHRDRSLHAAHSRHDRLLSDIRWIFGFANTCDEGLAKVAYRLCVTSALAAQDKSLVDVIRSALNQSVSKFLDV